MLEQRTGILSNAPLIDPRFGGASLVELHRGAVMCAPLEIDQAVQGVLYLDRSREGEPFTRFDLVLLQTFVRQGALGLRHIQLAQRAMGQADAQGEFLRLRRATSAPSPAPPSCWARMGSSLRWIQAYAESGYGDRAAILRHQAERLQYLVGSGLQETLLEVPLETPVSTSLGTLQAGGGARLARPAEDPDIALDLEAVPRGHHLGGGQPGGPGAAGAGGADPHAGARRRRGARGMAGAARHTGPCACTSRAACPSPPRTPGPSIPSRRPGIVWRWNDQALSLVFAKQVDQAPETASRPLLGLVTEEFELMWLFESVAAAGDLTLLPLEEEPPPPAGAAAAATW